MHVLLLRAVLRAAALTEKAPRDSALAGLKQSPAGTLQSFYNARILGLTFMRYTLLTDTGNPKYVKEYVT